MTYEEALILKKQKSNLIGTVDEKGFTIGEILIVPTNEKSRNDFFMSYLLNRNADMSIESFINEPMELWAIDTKHLEEANVLFYNKLS